MELEFANKLYSKYIAYDDRHLNKKIIIDDLILVSKRAFYGYPINRDCRYCNLKIGCCFIERFMDKYSDIYLDIKRKDIDLLFNHYRKKISDTNGIILSYLVKDTCQYC